MDTKNWIHLPIPGSEKLDALLLRLQAEEQTAVLKAALCLQVRSAVAHAGGMNYFPFEPKEELLFV